MAIYFIDSKNFSTATAVYTSSALTTKAADGFYQYCGVLRQQSGGLLTPALSCDDLSVGCVVPCGTDVSTALSGNNSGMYDFEVELSGKTGAVRVEMSVTLAQSSTAFVFQLGEDAYPNPVYGVRGRRSAQNLLAAYGSTNPIAERYTFGTAGNPCNADATIVTNLKLFQYYNSGWSWTNNINSEYITDATSIAVDPGTIVLYIPKTSPDINLLRGRIVEACNVGGYSSTATVFCPTFLNAFSSTWVNPSSAAACSAIRDNFMYQGHVNGVPGVSFGLYDWVFTDPYSQNLAPNGYYAFDYGTPKAWVRVENGIVIQTGTCPS
jgi:hypothetical protein